MYINKEINGAFNVKGIYIYIYIYISQINTRWNPKLSEMNFSLFYSFNIYNLSEDIGTGEQLA